MYKTKKKSAGFGVNIGTSSLLLVFVILCLISFATLSIVSANADKKLADKVSYRTEAYYKACSEANERLKSIDDSLKQVYDEGVGHDEYFARVGNTINFCVDITDIQALEVSVKINYPSTFEDPFYTVTSWSVETIGTLELDDSLDLISFE